MLITALGAVDAGKKKKKIHNDIRKEMLECMEIRT